MWEVLVELSPLLGGTVRAEVLEFNETVETVSAASRAVSSVLILLVIFNYF